MKIIKQLWEWVQKPSSPLKIIELAGRTCYKSEDKITDDSAEKFVRMINKRGHHSVIEHAVVSIKFITNRGVTHELVRHRLASYSQESSRYCNYSGNVEFILPVWMADHWCGYYDDYFSLVSYTSSDDSVGAFLSACWHAEQSYQNLLSFGWRPEQAREVLPNALKTEIVVTANLREWMHIFRLRTSKAAHPQMRALMLSCLEGFQKEIPVLFNNIGKE